MDSRHHGQVQEQPLPVDQVRSEPLFHLVAYRHHRLFSYAIPKKVWPPAWKQDSANAGLGVSTLVPSPDGTLWIVEDQAYIPSNYNIDQLISFRSGRFSSFPVDLGMGTSAPLADRRGDLWFCGGNGVPLVFDPGTQTLTGLSERGGNLVQGLNGRVWYVLPAKPTSQSGCQPSGGGTSGSASNP